MQPRSLDQDAQNTKHRNAKRARRERLFILRSTFLSLFSASRMVQNQHRCPADTAQYAAMQSEATQCPVTRRKAMILAPLRSDARGHQLCGVVTHPKDRPMPPQNSPDNVRNRNVYICKRGPTCVGSRQHLHAVLTCAGKRQRQLHLQASAGSCRNLNARADSRKHAPASASNCQHVQAEAYNRLHLKARRNVTPEGATCP